MAPEVVRRRYFRGIRNFFNIYRPLADTWMICDNSGSELVVVARGGRNTGPTVYDPRTLSRIEELAGRASTES